MGVPAAPPHILAGVTTILTLPSPFLGNGRDNQTESKRDKIPALIAAVYFFVCTRLAGRETNGKEYISQRRDVLSMLAKLREDQKLGEKIREKAKEGMEWEGWEDVGTKDVDEWLLDIPARGWLKLDWFENIIAGSGVGVNDDNNQFEDELDSHSPSVAGRASGGKNSLRINLGTMMQDQVDYLSEERRAEYRIWKEGILAKIDEMESERARVAMDTSDG